MVTIRGNIAALRALREISRSADATAQSLERLSSGLRINRASDDAAGLATADALRVRSRVYAQGVRNINDGISLLNVAQGALSELERITIRQKELAAQAANGVYSSAQRNALNNEANQLVEEFNRIVQSTEFNDIHLFDDALGELRIQFGFDDAQGIAFDIGRELGRFAGDGTFEAAASVGGLCNPAGVTSADVNNDGKLDLLSAETDGIVSRFSVYLGNGDGSFLAGTSYSTDGGLSWDLAAADFNRDGYADAVVANLQSGTVSILINRGDGTFNSAVTYSTGGTFQSGAYYGDVTTADADRDGILDLVIANYGSDTVSVLRGTGDGTFGPATTFATEDGPRQAKVGDFNNDGIPDLAVGFHSTARIEIRFGTGDGSFGAARSFYNNATISMELADLDNDGNLDIVANSTNNYVNLHLNNGNGTFRRSRIDNGVAAGKGIAVADINGDGMPDMIVRGGATDLSVLLGNGNGTFSESTAYDVGQNQWAAFGSAHSITTGDFNADGAVDIVAPNMNDRSCSLLLGNPRQISTVLELDLTSASAARSALDTISATHERVVQEMAFIGSIQSRLSFALRATSASIDVLRAAEGRIRDLDVAQETSELLRRRILQQSATAALAHANLEPKLVLTLLENL